MTTEINKASSDTGNSEYATCSPILRLLVSCCPSAISWFVGFLIVNPLNRQTGRSLPHIVQKVREFMPLGTHRNAPTAVTGKMRLFGIGASLKHGLPDAISRRHAFNWTKNSSRVTVFEKGVFDKTAARPAQSVFQTCIAYHFDVSALTLAGALAIYRSVWASMRGCITDHFKSSKLFSDQGYFRRHNVVFSMLCSVVGVRLIPALTAILPQSPMEST